MYQIGVLFAAKTNKFKFIFLDTWRLLTSNNSNFMIATKVNGIFKCNKNKRFHTCGPHLQLTRFRLRAVFVYRAVRSCYTLCVICTETI